MSVIFTLDLRHKGQGVVCLFQFADLFGHLSQLLNFPYFRGFLKGLNKNRLQTYFLFVNSKM